VTGAPATGTTVVGDNVIKVTIGDTVTGTSARRRR
jgi:hypothetical protein